jgi:hypothetical protein
MFGWTVVEMGMAVWVEPWFGLSAGAACLSFLVTILRPAWGLPLVSLDSLLLTAVVLLAWFPRHDLEWLREQRREARSRARRWLIDRIRAPEEGTRGRSPSRRSVSSTEAP